MLVVYHLLSIACLGALIALETWLYSTETHSDPITTQGLLLRCVAFGMPVLLLVLLTCILLVRRVMSPIRSIGDQLANLPTDAREMQITLEETDREYRTLTFRLNRLLRSYGETRKQTRELSARVAHELRAPVTLLQLQLDYAAPRLDPTFADGMRTQVKRLSEYVETALLVARAELGSIPIRKETVEIAQLVSELLDSYELRARRHRRTLTYHLPPSGLFQIDARIFALIFHNLLSNAFHHGVGEIRVRLYNDNQRTCLSIVNNIGNFGGSQVLEGGTGLGLNTVKVLAESHGGIAVRTRKFLKAFAAVIKLSR